MASEKRGRRCAGAFDKPELNSGKECEGNLERLNLETPLPKKTETDRAHLGTSTLNFPC